MIRKILILIFMVSTSFFLALSVYSAVERIPIMVFASSFLCWNSYLVSHYLVSGDFVDSIDEEIETGVPNTFRGIFFLVLSVFLIASGILFGVESLKLGSFSYTFFAAIIFWTGYIIAHYQVTGKVL